MKRILCLFLLTTPVLAEEWKPLLEGDTFNGWQQLGGEAEYVVEDGVITGTAVPNTPNSFMATEKDYGNFILELEFKVDPNLNSGVQIRSQSLPEYKEGRVHGYQVEIDPSDRGFSGGIYDEGRRGWLYPLKDKDEARYAFKQNDWNHYRIEAIQDSIRTYINGVNAADLKDDMTPAGFIALQVHGVGKNDTRPTVQWRNLRIQELPADATPLPLEQAEEPAAVESIIDADAEVVKLADGFKFTEGPAKGPDGRIYFNDIPNETTHVYDPETGETSVWRENTGRANGLWWTPGDRLLACEGGNNAVTRQLGDEVTVIVDSFDGKNLNSPNDLVLDPMGGIYFTDPSYGKNDDRELEKESVYYIDRRGKISLATEDVTKPNGIIFSPDYSVLYIADPGESKIWAFDVQGEGKLANKREFAPTGSDGMTVDVLGNVYITSEKVTVWNPAGELIAEIEIPERPANVTFGGPDNKTLYVTARTGFYAVELNVPGAL